MIGLFAHEILERVMVDGLIEAWIGANGVRRIEYQKFIAQYTYRHLTETGTYAPYYVPIIRQTIDRLVQHPAVKDDPANCEYLARNACACKAAHSGSRMLFPSPGERADQSEEELEANCLALAAWLGDMELVKSLHNGSDPESFFGRPSWAAAVGGHRDIVKYCLDHGASPYGGIKYLVIPKGPNAFAGAAYRGHEDVVRLYLEQPLFQFGECDDSAGRHAFLTQQTVEAGGVGQDENSQPKWRSTDLSNELFTPSVHAALGNQVKTLELLLEHARRVCGTCPKCQVSYEVALDGIFLAACEGGAKETAELAVELGADFAETFYRSRPCLTQAIQAGSLPLVKYLVEKANTLEDNVSGVLRRAWREAKSRGSREMMLAILPNRPLP